MDRKVNKDINILPACLEQQSIGAELTISRLHVLQLLHLMIQLLPCPRRVHAMHCDIPKYQILSRVK